MDKKQRVVELKEKATVAFKRIEPNLDKLEEDIIEKALNFGALQGDVHSIRPWLRHTIREQMYRLLYLAAEAKNE